uniref:Leucine-rich repeat-containing protein 71-like n=1 Tax=Saccoglossus kowalevskii TaxID=10224 RepID=A0ABM0MWW7_SACKO|nr:PREDICTED: leucine-rich repeat-containing protein 71-like [Saccoglossus kowalevskii]
MSNPARAPAAKQRFRSFVKKVKMGKRMERALKEKAASSTSQENADDESKTPEPYSCTGVFEQDFTELCRRAGLILGEIPPVVIRPKRPPTPPPADPKAQTVTEDGEEEQKEPEEPPPTTYTIKPKFEYFKPTVQVEMEHEDKPATVTEIFIRGWKVDEIMMSVLKQCLPKIEKLQSLYLWNTSLTGKTLADLASVLRECSNLKNLTIDGNPVEEENFALLIADDSPVANICLRNNKITDKGAELIGKALSTPRTCNKNLVSLNLSYNKITDVGAVAIANGLRMNRVLLSLSLASNLIGDVGAKTLSETLSRFALSHEEVVERRKLIRDKGSPDRISGKSPPPSRRADNKDRPGSKGSGTLLDKSDKKRDKSSKKKDATKGKEEDKTIKGGTKKEDKWKKETQRHGSKASVVAEVQGGKTAKGKKTVGGKDKKALLPEAETPDVVEAINPLMEQVENMDGKSWIPGNRALININLSRNKITEDGFESLLLAIQYQTTLAMMDPKPALKGLMRVSLNKNAVKPTNETAIKLQEIMVTKDPFYKPPSQSPDTDAQSHVGQ